ncbi:MAG: winged helix-turn-helix domain-containing protein [Roseivirga sp.]|nr:winged helix-turn-helix domain-containing protein [Roseivirga sp.]
MKRIVELSFEQARRLILHTQGLNQPPADSVEAIKKLSYVQIDSISVAARAHHHVFWSRNPDYQESRLDQMVSDREVFEYWSHAAAFLPMEDYRFSLYPKGEILKADKFWFEKDKKVMRHVMRRIKAEGPLQSKDFEHPPSGNNPWYEWKPTKVALQQLFMEGRLMVSGRQGFQKVYDLTERVLPEGIDLKKPTLKGFSSYLIDRAIQAQGLVTETEIGYLRKGLKKPIKRVLDEKVRGMSLIKVTLPGSDDIYYTTPEYLNSLDNLDKSEQLHLLSPFDNLVIQRKRLLNIFDFDYLIECYVPEKKRIYGYYVLPILWGERFAGRLDPKVDRKAGIFHIRNLWFEEGFVPDDEFLASFINKTTEFARFCGCGQVVVDKAPSAQLKRELTTRFKKQS